MEHRRNIVAPSPGTHFSSTAEPFRGHPANKSSSLSRQQRPSTSQQLTPPKKLSGFDGSLGNYSPRFQLLPLFTATTRPLSLSPLTAIITHARNTSTYDIISSVSSSRTVLSN